MFKTIKAQFNNARWDAGYIAMEAAYDLEWQGYTKMQAARRANVIYYWTVVKHFLGSLRFMLGHVVCSVFGHSDNVEVEEQIHGERDERGRWTDIDGCYVSWHCRRCNGSGGGWM